MNKFIKKEDMFVILDNAPTGVDKSKLIEKYVSNGYRIEGINDQEPVQPQKTQSMGGLDKATFQATGNEGVIGGALKTLGNIPSSGVDMVKNIAQAVTKPKQTIETVGTLVKGAGGKVAELALENTSFGQKFLEKANESRISRGLEPLKTVNGKLQAENTPEIEMLNQVGQFFKDRYGGVENIKETVIEDPVGILADLATVFTAGGVGATKIGQLSRASKVADVGASLSKVGQTLEPLNAISKGTSATLGAIKKTTPARIVGDIVPSINDLQKNAVVKALDLTQGDLATISKKTGNDVTEFIVSKNLLKETPEAIVDSLNDFRKSAKAEKADIISQVKNTYAPEQVPSVIKGLDTIFADVDGVAGLEKVADEIKTLRQKKQFTLEDIQNAQYLIDDNSSIYSKIGDTKSSKTAKGLDNIRKDIRKFIEDEVDTATGGKTNIRQLNNEIQTAFSVEDAINTRATRNLTRQKISLSDSVVLFGGGATFSPLVGVGLYLGKKAIESPSFRLAFTKALSAKPVAKVKQLVSEIKNKNVSKETQKFINELSNEARKNLQLVESGANVLDKSKQEKQK